MSTKNFSNAEITPKQCRAARILLEWKQEDLQIYSKLGITTIRDFEGEKRDLSYRSIRDIKEVFEKNGIVFENDEVFLGVKLKK